MIGPVVGGLTMSALVTGAVVLLAGGSQPEDAAPDVPARTYTTEQTVADDAPTTTGVTASETTSATTRTAPTASRTSPTAASPTVTGRARPTTTTPPPATTTDTTMDGPPERCPGNQPEHVRRKVCD